MANRHEKLPDEKILAIARSYNFNKDCFIIPLIKAYGKDNALEIIRKKGLSELRKGNEKDEDLLIEFGKFGYFKNKCFDEYFLKNVEEISNKLIKNKTFDPITLINKLRTEGVIPSSRISYIGEKKRNQLIETIKYHLPSLYDDLFHFYVENRAKKVPPQMTEDVHTGRIIEGIWNDISSLRKMGKFTKISPDYIKKIIKTTNHPIIRMWSRQRKKLKCERAVQRKTQKKFT